MKLAAISMIRDEADIVGTFLRHLAALFDLAFLLDQRSTDGTGEMLRQACAGRPGWTYRFMDFSGRHQKEVTTHFMAEAFAAGADAVFLLDSDEFLAVRSRSRLAAIAGRLLAKSALGDFRWRNCLPVRFDGWTFDPTQEMWIGPDDPVFTKLAVPRTLFRRFPQMRLGQGSHAAMMPEAVAHIPCGAILHVPIRSRQQFLQKVFLSAFANHAKNNPMIDEGVHKRRLLEIIAERDLTELEMLSVAAQFPAMEGVAWWTDAEAPLRHGFRRAVPDFALADLGLPALPRPDLAQLVARCLRDFRREDVEDGKGRLAFEGETVRFLPN